MLRLSFWSHGFLARTEYSSHMDRGQLASVLQSSVSQPQEKTGACCRHGTAKLSSPGLSQSSLSDQTSLPGSGEEEAEAGRGTWPVS